MARNYHGSDGDVERLEGRSGSDTPFDYGYFVKAMDKMSSAMNAASTAMSTASSDYEKKLKEVARAMLHASAGAADYDAKVAAKIEELKAAGNNDAQLRGAGVTNANRNSIKALYGEMSNAEEKYQAERKVYEQEHAAFSKKLLEVRLRNATESEKAAIHAREVELAESYNKEATQDRELMIAKREMYEKLKAQMIAASNAGHTAEADAFKSQMDAISEGYTNFENDINTSIQDKNKDIINSYKKESEAQTAEIDDLIKSARVINSNNTTSSVASAQNASDLKAKREELEKYIETLKNRIAEKDALAQEAGENGDTETQEQATAESEALSAQLDALTTTRPGNSKSAMDSLEDAERSSRVASSKKSLAESPKQLLDGIEQIFKDSEANLLDAINNAKSVIANALIDASKKVDEIISSYYQYQAKMEARLQGSDTTYAQALKTISKNVGLSPYVKQSKVVENLQTLIGDGIAYNVELRAFLATVSEDIASTFEANNKTLLKIIRLQQSDSTANRLGMEAFLTEFYNSLFKDTSYLSEQFDGVTTAIYEATSTLAKDQSMEFEYIVQKWLGSLYSVGLSDSTVSSIAQGINYLGTGDVESLNSNSQLLTLMAMSASKAGLPYADLLTGGMTAERTNELMKAMVTYLQEIAEQTKDNNVVAKAYTNILGISMSDLNAVQNINGDTLQSIYESILTYTDAGEEYIEQAGQIASRTHLSTITETLGSNALVSSATALGSTPWAYALWWAVNLEKGLTGGTDIPQVLAMGTGLDLHTKIEDLILTGMMGIGLVSSLIGAMASGGSVFGNYDLASWGYTDVVTRGSAPTTGSTGVQSGFSESAESSNGTANQSAEDLENATLASAASAAEEKGNIINTESGTTAEHTFDDFWDKIFEDRDPIPVEVLSNGGESILDKIYGALFVDRKAVLAEIYDGSNGSSGSGGSGSSSSTSNNYGGSSSNSITNTLGGASSDSDSYTSIIANAVVSNNSILGNMFTSLFSDTNNTLQTSLKGIDNSIDLLYNDLIIDRKATLVEVNGFAGSASYIASVLANESVTNEIIKNLQNTENSLSQLTSSENATDVNVVNIPSVSLATLSASLQSEIKAYIESTVREMLKNAIATGMTGETDTGEEGTGLAQIIGEILENAVSSSYSLSSLDAVVQRIARRNNI